MNCFGEIENYVPNNEQEASDQRIILEYIKTFPNNILLRDNEFAHMTCSGFIMNPSLDKVLMVHHNIYQTWAWTGGHADGNGNFLEVAMTEAMEETGISKVTPLMPEIASLDILPVYGHMKKDRYVVCHLHLNVTYILIAEESESLCMNEAENSGVQWIPADKIDQYSNEPKLIEVYNKLIEKARLVIA